MRAAPLPRTNPDLLVRPRLLALLDRETPVTWLLAPAGAGKTVLAAQWATVAAERGEQVLWFDGEVDPASAVVEALGGRAPGDQDDPAVELRRLRRDLRRTLHHDPPHDPPHDEVGPPFGRRTTVVLDHAEGLAAALGDELVALVRDVPGVRLVVCLRRRLEVMARSVGTVQSRTIGLAELRLDATEVRALARQLGLRLTAEEAVRIHASVDGWPVLLRMGFEDVSAGGEPAVAWSLRHLAWSLEGALATALPAAALDALCRAALVEEPTAGAVEAAVGRSDPAARRAFEELGVVDPVAGGALLLRFPPVLVDLFRRWYAARGLGPEGPVHERVVEHWLVVGDPRQALRQAVRGRCWPLAVRIVEEHWWAVAGHDLSVLPAAEVRGHPVAEIARQLGRPADRSALSPDARAREAELRVGPAATLAGHRDDPLALGLLTLALLGDRRRGDLAAALDLADRVEVVLGSRGADPGAVDRAAAEAGRARWLGGQARAARRVLRLSSGPRAAAEMALGAVVSGDRARVRRWRDRADAAAAPGRIAGAWEATQALDEPAAAEALASVEGVLGPADELWPLAAWIGAQHALAWGGRRRLLAELQAARGGPTGPTRLPWSRLLLVATEADLCLSLGRIGEATRVLAEVDASSPSAPALLSRARLARVVGRTDEALDLLEVLGAASHTSDLVDVERLLLRAWALDGAAGGPQDPAVVLAAALDLSRRTGLVLPFAQVPEELLDRVGAGLPGLPELVARLRAARVRTAYEVADDLPVLTPREQAVLAGLARGLSLADIGRDLFVSRNTVKTQAASLYRKLGVPGRDEAVAKARRTGLV